MVYLCSLILWLWFVWVVCRGLVCFRVCWLLWFCLMFVSCCLFGVFVCVAFVCVCFRLFCFKLLLLGNDTTCYECGCLLLCFVIGSMVFMCFVLFIFLFVCCMVYCVCLFCCLFVLFRLWFDLLLLCLLGI